MKMIRTCPKCKKEVELAKNLVKNTDDEEGDMIYELKCPHCNNRFQVIENND